MRKHNSIPVAVLDLILHVNRISSELVHRHIILLTLLLLEKLLIISPMYKLVNCVNIESEILHGNWFSSWK